MVKKYVNTATNMVFHLEKDLKFALERFQPVIDRGVGEGGASDGEDVDGGVP